jgi:transposase
MPRPAGSAELLEDRRRRALALLDEGRSVNDVGRIMDCAPSSVMRWRDARRRGGANGLKVRFSPGRPPRLGTRECRRVVRLLLRGAMAHGYATDLWTAARIAEVIERDLGVAYHRDHVGRLMHGLGWSHQKPERRALERDDKAIERWKHETWPRAKKAPRGWAPTSTSSTSRASS